MDVHALQEALLTPEGPWSALDVLDTVDSTNLEALRDPRPWRVVLAEHQSAGRGRLTRQWEAPARASVAVSVVLLSITNITLLVLRTVSSRTQRREERDA